MITDTDLENWFNYHAPADTPNPVKDVTPETAYKVIRKAGLDMARVIVLFTPSCPDQTTAVRKIREAVMTANAAVACGGS